MHFQEAREAHEAAVVLTKTDLQKCKYWQAAYLVYDGPQTIYREKQPLLN
jgi:hypothetical protein